MRIALLAVLAFLQEPAKPRDEREKWLPALKSVTLDRGERSVKQVLEAIRSATGLAVESSGLDEERKVTLELKDRPVLAALDDLCRALGKGTVKVREDSDAAGAIEVDGEPELPVAGHWRQFRVEVEDVQVTVRRSLEKVQRSARVTLRMTLQPGAKPLSVGAFQPEEAQDDAGWSLLSSVGEARQRYRSSEEFEEGEEPDAVILEDRFDRGRRGSLTLDLNLPGKEAKSIEKLRGRVPVTFPLRFVDLKVPAGELVDGKELKLGAMTVRVKSFAQSKGKATLVYQVLGGRRGRDFPSFPDFELLDDKDGKLSQGHSGNGSDDGYTMEYTLAGDAPVQFLRLAGYVGRVTLMVPVELRNIPLPAARKP